MLEPGLSIRKTKCEKSKWTAEYVSKMVMDTIEEWLVEQDLAYKKDYQGAFMIALVDFLFASRTRLEPEGSNECGFFRVRADDLVSYLGSKAAGELAAALRRLRQESLTKGYECRMTPLSFARSVLHTSAVVSAMSKNGLVKRKKKTMKRIEFTFVHSKLFGEYRRNGEFEFYS